jgi:small subunit ribosomal protein S15
MSILTKSKKEVIKEFAQAGAKGKADTGSVEVQAAVITKQINNLTEHLKVHKSDFSSRRGLLILVSRRRSLLDYLKSKSAERYANLIKKLEIRK